MSPPVLKVHKLSERATIPQRSTPYAAGLDLCSAYNYFVPANSRILVLTDLQIELPNYCYGRIAPRSGLALKHTIDIAAGVIDTDYRGNVGIVFCNSGDTAYHIKEGDRIAQLILERIWFPTVKETRHPLTTKTTRGQQGFGSSGL